LHFELAPFRHPSLGCHLHPLGCSPRSTGLKVRINKMGVGPTSHEGLLKFEHWPCESRTEAMTHFTMRSLETRQKQIIRTDLREAGRENGRWIKLAQDRVEWPVLVLTTLIWALMPSACSPVTSQWVPRVKAVETCVSHDLWSLSRLPLSNHGTYVL
jgi:hypothetical protein